MLMTFLLQKKNFKLHIQFVKMSLAPYVFLHLLFLSQLNLHSAKDPQPDCWFSCGSLGKVGPPFSNTANSKCGVFLINCTEPSPRVQFHRNGTWHPINRLENWGPQHGNIEIHDHNVQTNLESDRCDLLQNYTEQAFLERFDQQWYPFLSFSITETRPFFKCVPRPTHHSEFFTAFHNYTKCNNSILYYYVDKDKKLPALPQTLSHLCSVVDLPSATPQDLVPIGSDNLTLHWSANFVIQWKVLPECEKCYKEESQCLSNQNKDFQCRKLKGTNISRKIQIVIALLVAGVGSTIVLRVLVYYISKKKRATSINFEAFMKNQVSLAPKRYNFKEIKKMTKSFKNKLGQGGYGSVFQGMLSDGNFVAVKVLTHAKGNGEEFINEVASISRTSHVNIVSLLGYCFDGSKRALIYEYMPNGSLEKYIFNNESSGHSNLGWGTLFKIAVGIARGLEYLHRGCNTRILHFDIKPHNILLDQDFCPKISDFGLAKLCPSKDSIISMLGARGTVGYIAPEVFCRNFGGVSHKSDVYSYGMMILEMVGGRKNIDVAVDHSSEIYFPHWIYKRIELDEQLGLHGIVSEEQAGQTRKMILVGLWCIQTNPADRPSISRVLEMLEGSVEVLEMPPKPYLSSPSRNSVS